MIEEDYEAAIHVGATYICNIFLKYRKDKMFVNSI